LTSRIVYSTDPVPPSLCPRCGMEPCVCELVDLAPRQQTAYIQRDRKRRGGKTVTVISGLQHNAATYRSLLQDLKVLCGAGGTLKDGTLEVQGDHRERIAGRLRELGYKVKLSGG